MQKFTIIIPTYNRPAYLKNLLSYLNNFNLSFNIVVADSSSTENKLLNEKVITENNFKKNITYLNDFSNDINLVNKLLQALSTISTLYSVICADDDFISPESIKFMTDFLDSNTSYSAAHGRYLGFWEVKINDKMQIRWNNKYRVVSIEQDSPTDRFIFHFLNYGAKGSGLPTFYSVHKTEFLKEIFGEVSKYTDDMRFGEILLSLLTVIHGKIKCFNLLYGFRRSNDLESSGATISGFSAFIKDGTFNYKYSKFKNCLINNFKKEFSVENQNITQIINTSMFMYLVYSKKVSKKNQKIRNLLEIKNRSTFLYHLRFIFNKNRTSFYLFTFKLYFLKGIFRYNRNNKYINISSNQLVKKYYQKLKPINNILLLDT